MPSSTREHIRMLLNLFNLLTPLMRILPPETAHEVTLRTLEYGIYPKQSHEDDIRFNQNIFGYSFPNPIGIAAGFDKNGRVPHHLLNLGFGFVEVGTLTPKPQNGNPKPRLFRLYSDQAILNRMGFNNQGFSKFTQNYSTHHKNGIVGINIGANKNSQNPNEDYVSGIQNLNQLADYFTINISSPNTPGLRDLQNPEKLNQLLSWLMATRGALMSGGHPWRPILVKLSPDIFDDELPQIIDCLLINAVDGIIISNTTTSRDGLHESGLAGESGGLSGKPLFQNSTHVLAKVYRQTKGAIPLIGVGGIDSGETALAKIQAGASLIQLYTGLVYKGPGLISKIKKHLINHMEVNNLQSISQITGSQADAWAENPDEITL